MRRLSNRQATLYAAITFGITLVLSYFLPGYSVTLSGLLISWAMPAASVPIAVPQMPMR